MGLRRLRHPGPHSPGAGRSRDPGSLHRPGRREPRAVCLRHDRPQERGGAHGHGRGHGLQEPQGRRLPRHHEHRHQVPAGGAGVQQEDHRPSHLHQGLPDHAALGHGLHLRGHQHHRPGALPELPVQPASEQRGHRVRKPRQVLHRAGRLLRLPGALPAPLHHQGEGPTPGPMPRGRNTPARAPSGPRSAAAA